MHTILTSIAQHRTVDALVAFWLWSNFVSALPTPQPQSGNLYKFFFQFMSGLAGSLPRFFPNLRIPSKGNGNGSNSGSGSGGGQGA